MKTAVSPGPSFVSNPLFKRYNDELRKRGHEIAAPRLGSMLSCDLFHVNFPEHMVSETRNILRALANVAAMLCFMGVVKLRRKKIIWTVHDVLPLRSNHGLQLRLCSIYMALVRKMTDGYIFLSPSSRQTFASLYPQEQAKPTLESFIPAFPVSLLDETKKTEYRQQLGLNPDDFIVGFLGYIKPYKNPGIVSLIPETLDNGRKVALLVAGQALCDTTSLEEALVARKSVRINKHLEDSELEALIQIVDVVLLPYAWGWNSGFLLLVLSCHQRTLASNLPIFTDMQTCFGKKWVSIFDLSATDQKAAIDKAINELATAPSLEADRQRLKDELAIMYSVSRFTDQIVRFYRSA